MPVKNDQRQFVWDFNKDRENQRKHGVSFEQAKYAFDDIRRIILPDASHSHKEARFFCLGRVADGIMTVRFTLREAQVRIFGAGYWRKGKKEYERRNG